MPPAPGQSFNSSQVESLNWQNYSVDRPPRHAPPACLGFPTLNEALL
jgi:hypothetical protein